MVAGGVRENQEEEKEEEKGVKRMWMGSLGRVKEGWIELAQTRI